MLCTQLNRTTSERQPPVHTQHLESFLALTPISSSRNAELSSPCYHVEQQHRERGATGCQRRCYCCRHRRAFGLDYVASWNGRHDTPQSLPFPIMWPRRIGKQRKALENATRGARKSHQISKFLRLARKSEREVTRYITATRSTVCHLSGRFCRRCASPGPSLLSRLPLTLSGRMVHKVQRVLSIVPPTNNTGLSSVKEKSS